jgi:hypothetical protein
MEQYRMALPYQRLIKNKQVRHLCTNPMIQTLNISDPTDEQKRQFTRIKQAWEDKNMEGAKTTFVSNQKSYGDAALLFFMADGKLCTKNFCFADDYTIITHKNDAGNHILECLMYEVDDITYVDCYDATNMTRLSQETQVDMTGKITSSWKRYSPVRHGFSECPLITKRGEVAWNNGEALIESLESLYNVFIVTQKRHGWGLIYIKGQFSQNAQRIAGSAILNDSSLDPNADAKILNPPDPTNMTETIKTLEDSIQKACGTTFIMPKDINISGDTSGVAVEMTQELDMATAEEGVSEWQNVANKMMRLFIEGIAMELTNTGDDEFDNPAQSFKKLRVQNSFSVWKPKSEEAHNSMVEGAFGAGIISLRTAVEKNTLSTPDELARIEKETKEKEEKELLQKQAENGVDGSQTTPAGGENNTKEVIDVVNQ